MPIRSVRRPAPPPGVRQLSVLLYGYAFLDDLVLLYPVYALLFADTGLSVWQISSLFVIWSSVSVLLEVPSGVWADAVSRRMLLCLGPVLSAAGFALWVLVPCYASFAVGFVLWGAKGALESGALEALVYEELDHLGAADRYAGLMGRATAAGSAGVVAATGLAALVLAAGGGYLVLGLASVAACLATAAVATRFPEHRERGGGADGDGDGDGAGWAATFRDGVREVRSDRAVRGAVLIAAVVTSVWGALEEYTPLLVAEIGASGAAVPLLQLVIWVGTTAGGLLAARAERLGARGLGLLLAGGAAAMAVGAGLVRSPLGIIAVAAAFGAFQLATVLADARLQHRITGASRATVTSFAGVAMEVNTLAVYGGYAVLGSVVSHGTAFAAAAGLYVAVALRLVAGAMGATRAVRTAGGTARRAQPAAAREPGSSGPSDSIVTPDDRSTSSTTPKGL